MSALPPPKAFAVAARIIRAITYGLLAVAVALFLEAMVVHATEIVLRGFFRTSFPEYYEIVGYSFIYVFLLGAAALYARDEDIVMELVFRRLPEAAGRWQVFLVHAAIAVTMAVVLVGTVKIIGLQMNTRTPLLGVPESIKWIPLAIAAAVITLSSAVEAWGAAIWISTGGRPRVWTKPWFDLLE